MAEQNMEMLYRKNMKLTIKQTNASKRFALKSSERQTNFFFNKTKPLHSKTKKLTFS